MASNISFQTLSPNEVQTLLDRKQARDACLDLMALLKVILAPCTNVVVFPMVDYGVAEQLIDVHLDGLPHAIKNKMSANKDLVFELRDAYLAPRDKTHALLQNRIDECVETLIDQHIALQPVRTLVSTNSRAATSSSADTVLEYKSEP